MVAIVTILAALAPVQAGADDESRRPGAATAAHGAHHDHSAHHGQPIPGSHAGRDPAPRPQPETGAAAREEAAEAAAEETADETFEAVTAAPRHELPPVLPLGTGLACLGLGIGLIGYRLRRS